MSNALELIVRLKNQTQAGVNKIKTGMKGLEAAAGKVTGAVFNLKSALGSIVVGVGLKNVIDTFAGFDDQMRAVGAISGATAEQLAALTAKAEELGSKTRYSASQAAEAFQFLSMSGMSVDQSLKAVDGVLQVAAANMMDLGTTTDIVTNVLSGMKLPIEELGRVNDVLTKAAHSANTSVTELGEAMKVAGPAAKGSNEELESVVAVLGGLADNGIKGAESGHAVKRMLLALQKPNKEAAETLAELGIETRNADGSFRGLIPILQDLGKKQIDLVDATKIFGRYTGTAGVAAANYTQKIGDLEVKLQSAAGTSAKAAEQMESGLGGSIRALKSAWEGLLIALGRGLEGNANDFIKKFTQQIQEARELVIRFTQDGSLAEWAGGISEAFSIALDWVKDLISYIPELNAAIQSGFAEIEIKFNEMVKLLNEIRAWGANLSGNNEQEQYFLNAAQAAQANIDALKNIQTEINNTVVAQAKLPKSLEGLEAEYNKFLKNVEGLEAGTLKWGETTKQASQAAGKAVSEAADVSTESWQKTNEETKKAAEEFQKVWDDSILKVDQALAEPKPVNVSTEQAKTSVDELREAAENAAVKISQPIQMDIDTEPAKAALADMAKTAQQEAAQAYKSMLEMKEAMSSAFGESRAILQRNYEQMFKTYNESKSKWESLKKEVQEPVESTIDFKGKASPVRPLGETIKNVITGLKQIGTEATKGVEKTIKFPVISQAASVSPPPASAGAGIGLAGLKDYGKLTLNVNGRGGDVIGKPDVLKWVKEAVEDGQRLGYT